MYSEPGTKFDERIYHVRIPQEFFVKTVHIESGAF